jgi:hypothetical protein
MLKRDLVFCRRDWKTLGFLYLKYSSQERTETPKAGGRKGVVTGIDMPSHRS